MKNTYFPDGSLYPIADEGAMKGEYDEQRALVKTPEPERQLTDYELLQKALYDRARDCGSDAYFTEREAECFEVMGFPDLAHSIREGLRDASKVQKTHNATSRPQCKAETETTEDSAFSPAFFDSLRQMMHDGKSQAEIVEALSSKQPKPLPTNVWIPHDGKGMPEGLDGNERVEVPALPAPDSPTIIRQTW